MAFAWFSAGASTMACCYSLWVGEYPLAAGLAVAASLNARSGIERQRSLNRALDDVKRELSSLRQRIMTDTITTIYAAEALKKQVEKQVQ